MKLIENISDEAYQRHKIITQYGEITLSIRYYQVTELWFIDVEYLGESIKGVKLSLGVQHVNGQNWPFGFIVQDVSGKDVDPFQVNDFSEKRCLLYMLEYDDMEELRGYSVRLQ